MAALGLGSVPRIMVVDHRPVVARGDLSGDEWAVLAPLLPRLGLDPTSR